MADVASIVVLVDADGRRRDRLDFKHTEVAVLSDGTRIKSANSSGGTSFGGGGFFAFPGENGEMPSLDEVVRDVVAQTVRENGVAHGPRYFEALAESVRDAGFSASAEQLHALPVEVEFTPNALRLIASLAC